DGPRRMLGMGRRDIDRVDVRVGQQSVIAMMDTRSVKMLSVFRPVRIARTDGFELSGLRMRQPAGKGARDAARTQNAPTDLLLLRHVCLPHARRGRSAPDGFVPSFSRLTNP